MLVRGGAWEWGWTCAGVLTGNWQHMCSSVSSQLTLHVLECWQSTDITCAQVLAVNWHYMCSSVDSQLTLHVLKCWQSTDSTCTRVLTVLSPSYPSFFLLRTRWWMCSTTTGREVRSPWAHFGATLTSSLFSVEETYWYVNCLYSCIPLYSSVYLLYSCELVMECRGLICGSPR